MRVLILRENGTREEALLLAVSERYVRAAVAGGGETEEFTVQNGRWEDENGAGIELEAALAIPGVSSWACWREVRPLTARVSA